MSGANNIFNPLNYDLLGFELRIVFCRQETNNNQCFMFGLIAKIVSHELDLSVIGPNNQCFLTFSGKIQKNSSSSSYPSPSFSSTSFHPPPEPILLPPTHYHFSLQHLLHLLPLLFTQEQFQPEQSQIHPRT